MTPVQSDPPALRLDPQAHAEFNRFRAVIEKALRPGEELGGYREWGGKFPGAVLRIAGILQLCSEPTSDTIRLEIMQNAIRIGKYLVEHMKGAFQLMGADPMQAKSEAILTWLRKYPVVSFTKNQAFNALRATFRKASEIDAPLADLCQRNYLRKTLALHNDHRPGRSPSPAFEVNPSLLPAYITHNTHITLTATMSQQGEAHKIAAARQAKKETRNPLGDFGKPRKELRGRSLWRVDE